MPSPGQRQRPSLLQKAIALLARRDYSRLELEQRLQQHLRALARETSGETAHRAARHLAHDHGRDPATTVGGKFGADSSDSPGDLTSVLDRLQAEGKLSDDRFAASFARQRATRFGNARLRHDLRAKGLAPELVAATLATLPSAELDRARDLWSKRFGKPPPDRTEWARQARFLAQRGFSTESIRAVLRNAPGTDDQDTPAPRRPTD
jgi:regulatory protein